MSALEAGDDTFVRIGMKPTPPSLDYKCSCCGKKLTAENYGAYIGDDLKLVIHAYCCDRDQIWRVYLGFGGVI